MVELPVYEVKIQYDPNARHMFLQTFIGKPTVDDVIEFVRGMAREDTYAYVIDLMVNQGLPTRAVATNENEWWAPIGPQDSRAGSIVIRKLESIPVTRHYNIGDYSA